MLYCIPHRSASEDRLVFCNGCRNHYCFKDAMLNRRLLILFRFANASMRDQRYHPWHTGSPGMLYFEFQIRIQAGIHLMAVSKACEWPRGFRIGSRGVERLRVCRAKVNVGALHLMVRHSHTVRSVAKPCSSAGTSHPGSCHSVEIREKTLVGRPCHHGHYRTARDAGLNSWGV
jgi:hypothetical protein